uniref:Cha101 n=1 Tax=Arundo donax TaxID=35708 RepID=A0A0A9CMQ7_ARUDO
MDAKWHEASKQRGPFFSLQFLLVALHFLSQKNQTMIQIPDAMRKYQAK